MAIRFRKAGRSSDSIEGGDPGDAFGHWWAATSMITVAAIAVLSLGGEARSVASTDTLVVDPTPEILASLQTAEHALEAIERELGTLCREPVLAALELEPDCKTGVVTLGDDLFGGSSGSRLRAEGKEYVSAAVTAYLERLRRLPALWESLEAIEVRGHSDPRALRDAYRTNLIGSQQRATGVLLFLMGPEGLAPTDQEDLQRLAIVSAAAFSRPPESCPEASRECFSAWRRVEIVPVLAESRRRKDWARTVEDVRVLTRRAQEKIGTEAPAMP